MPASPHLDAAPVTRARGAGPAALAALLDAVAVLAFVAAGRSSHTQDGGFAGTLGTAWPFLAAGAVGWLVVRAWRAPWRPWPVGVAVWAATWAGGLALRGLSGDGLAPAFVAVSAGVLALLLLGWRALATAVSPRARRRPSGPARRR